MSATTSAAGSSYATLVPESGAVCLEMGTDVTQRGRNSVTGNSGGSGGSNGGGFGGPAPFPWPEDEGGGGYRGAPREDFNTLLSRGLAYNSQTNLNRMTGNWWFPLDIFLVVQPNGDLHYYGPNVVGAVYAASGGAYVSPPGTFDVMAANGDGTWTRTTKHGTRFHFNAFGYLDWMSDRYGRQLTVARGSGNRLNGWIDYASRVTTVSYYANGYASGVTDSAGRTWAFAYTPEGYLASLTYPSTTYFDRVSDSIVTGSKTVSFGYISGTSTALDGNVTQIVDAAGIVAFSTGYDAYDRATTTSTYGRTWTYAYLPSGEIRTVDPDGVTIDYGCDALGSIVSKKVWTASGLGKPPLRVGEPTAYVWTYARNSAYGCSLITKLTRPDGSCTEVDYDQWGNPTRMRHKDAPSSGGTTLIETRTWSSFAQYCRLLSYASPCGHHPGAAIQDFTTTWTYDSLGSVTGVAYPRSALAASTSHVPVMWISRNCFGQAITVTAPGGMQIQYEYAAVTGELVRETRDAGGIAIVTEYTYDALGRRTAVKNPRGFTTTYAFNALDQVVSVEGPQPLAPKTTYLYDNNNLVRQVAVENKDPTGTVDSANPTITLSTNSYNTGNLLTSTVSEIDASTTGTITFAYTPAGRIQSIVDPNGHQTRFLYDERGLLHQCTRGYGTAYAATTAVTYDLNGRVSATVDPRGNSTSTEHNHVGWPVKRTLANGLAEHIAWDEDGNSTGATTVNSGGILQRSTVRTFDPFGHLLSHSQHLLDASGSVTSTLTSTFDYDTALRVVSLTNPRGNTIGLARDTLGRITQRNFPSSDQELLAYDGNGNVTTVTAKDWNPLLSVFEQVVIENTYDTLDRRTGAVERDGSSALTRTWSRQYDGLGRLLTSTDETGNTIHYEWSARGQLLKTTRDLRAGGVGGGAVTSTVVTQRQYDLGGRLIARVDSSNQQTLIAYDALNRVVSTTNASSEVTAVAYDANGNPTQITDPVGTVVTATYSSMNWLTSRGINRATGIVGTTFESYTYDEQGRLLTAQDDDSTVQVTWDSLNRMTSETQGPNPLGGSGQTFSYAHNAVGSITSVTFPGGTVEQRSLDSAERVSSVSLAGGPTLATYTWTGSRPLQIGLQNGVSRSVTYDVLRRETRVKYATMSTTLQDFQYFRDLGGRRLLEKRHHAGGSGDMYDYDSLYRTIQVKQGVADPIAEFNSPGSQSLQATIVPTYDVVGSRMNVAVTTSSGTTNTVYTGDALGFYTAIGSTTQVRDANGNLIDDGTHLYDYDYRNQLVRVRLKSNGSMVAQYDYDALGRRTSKATAIVSIVFLWRGEQLAEEWDSSGLLSRRHLGAGFGEVVAATNRDLADLNGIGGTSDYVLLTPLYDAAFDCVGVLGPMGRLVESYVSSYDGKLSICSAAGNPIGATAIGWSQGYGGMYFDTETAHYYSLFRYYVPSSGRYLTEDPAGRWFDPGSMGNGYTWVADGYRNGFDPLGLARSTCCGQKFAVFIWDRDPWGGGGLWNGVQKALGNPNYQQAVKAAYRAAAKKYGQSNVYSRGYHFGAYGNLSANDQAWIKYHFDKLMWAANQNPCFDGFVFFGHGNSDPSRRGEMILPWDSVDPQSVINAGANLDVYVNGACWGGLQNGDAGGRVEPDNADAADDTVDSDRRVNWSNVPLPGTSSGKRLGQAAERAIGG